MLPVLLETDSRVDSQPVLEILRPHPKQTVPRCLVFLLEVLALVLGHHGRLSAALVAVVAWPWHFLGSIIPIKYWCRCTSMEEGTTEEPRDEELDKIDQFTVRYFRRNIVETRGRIIYM